MARTLIVLDPNLRNLLGHYFEYDRSVAEAAILKGLECIILSHREAVLPPGLSFAVHPVYSADIWRTLPGEKYHSESNITAVSAAFASETLDFLGSWPLNQGDILFLPTITQAQLPGAAALAEALGPRGVCLCIMLRYQRTFYDGPTAAQAFRRLEKAAKKYSIILSTDSHRLARQLGTLTALSIQVFPIPHTDYSIEQRCPSPGPNGTVHFVSLGNARGEKGLAEIMKAIRKSAHEPWAGRVRFTLQCNDPSADVVGALENFRKNPDWRVTSIDQILSSNEYYRLLLKSDVVLVPYHRGIYNERTSGVFMEAITAGKVVMCTDDTWMSDLLEVHGGGIAVADRSVTDLCSAISKITTDFSRFRERALMAAAHWKKIHSADNLVAHLLGDLSNPAIVRTRARAAVIFPWGNAVEGNSGAAVRLKLLVKYLEQTYEEVRVLFTAVGERGGRLGAKTFAEPYYYMRIRSRLLYAGLEFFSRMLGGKKGQSFHLWFHLWPWIDGRFQARCEEIIRWADDVYLEYSYFAPVVGRISGRYGKPLVVTQHDIVSEQSKGVPLIYRATQKLEFHALRRAPRVILCTDGERALAAAHGIVAELIPHPVDIKSRSSLTAEEAALILNALYAVPDGRQICFFIGSAYEPNRKAAQFIRGIAERMQDDPRASNLMFVVAGACMEPEHNDNFLALGIIEEVALSAFYEIASVVLVPVTEGTGSAIKCIEAMACGSVILSTSVGMRGIPVEPKKHCLIEDDLSLYPERILEIISDHETADRIRVEVKSFGAAYDYRSLFAQYDQYRTYSTTTLPLRLEELEDCRRKAIQELLPRMQQLKDSDTRRRFRDQFGLTEHELPFFVDRKAEEQEISNQTAADKIVSEPAMQAKGSPEHAMRTVTTGTPLAKRSFLWRLAKQISLSMPPVQVLYREVLLANARTTAREAELRKEEGRVALLDSMLRIAEEHNAHLETDRARAEEERAAVEARFLERFTGLEELLRVAEERNVRLEADRAQAEEERAAVEARFLERFTGLEELLRVAEERNARLETDRARAEEERARDENTILRNALEAKSTENTALQRRCETQLVQNLTYKTESATWMRAYLDLVLSNEPALRSVASSVEKSLASAVSGQNLPLPPLDTQHSTRDHAIFEWQVSDQIHNFGDHLSRLIGESVFTPEEWSRLNDDKHSIFALLGSVLCDYRIETMVATGRVPVFIGCGFRGEEISPELISRSVVHGCRGYLSQAALARASVFTDVVGDPAALLPLLEKKTVARSGSTLLVPHINDPKLDSYRAPDLGCASVASPRTHTIEDVKLVIAKISSADFVLAGSMHAAIVAHAYDAPFALFSNGFVDCPDKWQDWLTSIGLAASDAVFCKTAEEGRAWYKACSSRIRKRHVTPLLSMYNKIGLVRPHLWYDALRHDLQIH